MTSHSEASPTGPPRPKQDSTSTASGGTGKPESVGDSSNISAPPLPTPPLASNVNIAEELPGLPRLNYNLWDYKTKLFIVSGLLIIESSLLPIALFYGLWFHTTLRHGIVFAIITAFFGLVTGIEFGLRSLKLIMKADTYRPIGGKRWHFDFTHTTLSIGYTIMTGILIGASIPHEPLVRPLAIPVPLFLIQIGLQLLVTGWQSARNHPAPYRISSIPKGSRVVPLVYTLVEDIVAVDGAAGLEYRQALLARYETSSRFRRMIAEQNWFWGIGSLIDGIGTMVVIWTVPQEVAYGVGWGSPLVFATLWTIITVIWVRKRLRQEKELWRTSCMSSAPASHAVEMQQQANLSA
ncbi:hypothetical protein B0H66DRAFT_273493 [Apodospora peruviana]|uniref:Uncharacterized protein n=1 Tax=Apodospora peruviana TaxID=516989 RepID=A0AAE0I016_9PEZI|nr:hypothetical protein B0H66DRAFT_273493 [Apodospora peruviana]